LNSLEVGEFLCVLVLLLKEAGVEVGLVVAGWWLPVVEVHGDGVSVRNVRGVAWPWRGGGAGG
jgi:hypothetical protein